MAVHARVGRAGGGARQEVGGLEAELFVDAHAGSISEMASDFQGLASPSRDADELMGLQGQAPDRVRLAVGDGELAYCAPAPAPSMGCRKRWAKPSASRSAGSRPACGKTSFNSSPERCFRSVPALGLTQTQSIAAGTGRVPLVSIAMVKPRACKAAISGVVDLQHRLAAGEHDEIRAGVAGSRARTRPQAPRRSRSGRRRRRPCRRSRCRRSGSGRRRGPARAPTTDCSRRSGRTRRRGPRSRPRPAACRKSPSPRTCGIPRAAGPLDQAGGAKPRLRRQLALTPNSIG